VVVHVVHPFADVPQVRIEDAPAHSAKPSIHAFAQQEAAPCAPLQAPFGQVSAELAKKQPFASWPHDASKPPEVQAFPSEIHVGSAMHWHWADAPIDMHDWCPPQGTPDVHCPALSHVCSPSEPQRLIPVWQPAIPPMPPTPGAVPASAPAEPPLPTIPDAPAAAPPPLVPATVPPPAEPPAPRWPLMPPEAASPPCPPASGSYTVLVGHPASTATKRTHARSCRRIARISPFSARTVASCVLSSKQGHAVLRLRLPSGTSSRREGPVVTSRTVSSRKLPLYGSCVWRVLPRGRSSSRCINKKDAGHSALG
jgi:hypothetical protein